MVNRRFHHKHALQISGKKQLQNKLLMLISVVFPLLAVTFWSYWRIEASIFRTWKINDDYSAGQLVPVVALLLLWRERKNLRECQLKPCWWGGIALLIVAQAARFYGLVFMFQSIDNYSLVLTIAGLVLMVAGWQVFRRLFWIMLFLFLMLPLPGRIHNMISGPLQNMATTGAVFLMEAFGVSVSQQGNVMMMNQDTPLAVAEACNGLRMLTAFIIVAAFIAYMVKRSRLQKAVLLASSIPVAVISNIIRIFVAAVLMVHVSGEVADKFFHDFAGLVMMPAAVLILFGELWLMNKLTLPEFNPEQDEVITKIKKNTHAKTEVLH
jgi:exosortase